MMDSSAPVNCGKDRQTDIRRRDLLGRMAIAAFLLSALTHLSNQPIFAVLGITFSVLGLAAIVAQFVVANRIADRKYRAALERAKGRYPNA